MNSKVNTPGKKRPPAKRGPAIPFPDLPDALTVSDALFWRAAWLRAEAQLAAIREHAQRVFNQRQTTRILRLAIIEAEHHLQDSAQVNFDRLVRAGGLLYAWIPEGAAS